MKEFAYITDIHLDEQLPREIGVDTRNNFLRILADVSSRKITKIICEGDIGELSVNQWFFETLQPFELNLTLGNHDDFREVIQHFGKNLINGREEFYYSFEDEYFKIIFLDSSSYQISQNQFEWFETELKTDKHILLFVHHPILELNTVVDTQYPLKNRETIKLALLKSNRKTTIFCGHCHQPDERNERNITQFVTPASAYQVEKYPRIITTNSNSFGYRIVQIDGDQIDSEIVYLQN